MGLGDAILENIQLAVGQEAVIHLALKVTETSRKQSGKITLARVNLTSGALSGLVDHIAIRDLPLKGRSTI